MILLPLAHLSQRDLLATVAVFPSDHFIKDEDLFVACLQKAITETKPVQRELGTLPFIVEDLGLITGWFEELPDHQRQNLWKYLKRPAGDSGEAAPALMRVAWSSGAALAMAPLQDLVNLGREPRMNIPGRPEGN